MPFTTTKLTDLAVTPTSRYVASANPALAPASASMAMVYPDWISFLQDSGTKATRRSPGEASGIAPFQIVRPSTIAMT